MIGADVPAFWVVHLGEFGCGEKASLHVWSIFPAEGRKVRVDRLDTRDGGDVGWHAESAEERVGAVELGVETLVSGIGVAGGVHIAGRGWNELALRAHSDRGCAEVVARAYSGGRWDHESDV